MPWGDIDCEEVSDRLPKTRMAPEQISLARRFNWSATGELVNLLISLAGSFNVTL